MNEFDSDEKDKHDASPLFRENLPADPRGRSFVCPWLGTDLSPANSILALAPMDGYEVLSLTCQGCCEQCRGMYALTHPPAQTRCFCTDGTDEPFSSSRYVVYPDPPTITTHLSAIFPDDDVPSKLAGGIYRVRHSCPQGQLLETLEQAIGDFLRTHEGKDIAQKQRGDFNWGDAVVHIRSQHWSRYGISSFETVSGGILVVEHDHNFFSELLGDDPLKNEQL